MINKNDFKTLFHIMRSNTEEQSKNLILNIKLNKTSGNSAIDSVIKNNSPLEVSKMMEKILNKVILGGSNLSTTSQEQFGGDREIQTTTDMPTSTSSEIRGIFSSGIQPSETSSDIPLGHSSRIPSGSTTSDIVDGFSQIQPSTTSSDISDSYSKRIQTQPTDVKITIRNIIDKLKEKSDILDIKESTLKSLESELNNKKMALEEMEIEIKNKVQKLVKEIESLSKEKSDLESSVSSLKTEKKNYMSELSEISLNFKDISTDRTDSKPKTFLSSLFDF